jgi:hypothetical protein
MKSTAEIGLANIFPIKNGCKQDALSPLLYNFVFSICHKEGSGKPRGLKIKWYISTPGMLMKLIYWVKVYILYRKTQKF